ncbi:MAG: hypothetical protein HYZ09_02195 [Candidatus Kerfeldbacteria bacterium]|nr:hypothetical protein [Candidatus Kerfeldbacteria bacterium]
MKYPPGWYQDSGGSAMFLLKDKQAGPPGFQVGIVRGNMYVPTREGPPRGIGKEEWIDTYVRHQSGGDRAIRIDYVARNNLEMVRVVDKLTTYSTVDLTYYYFTNDNHVYRIYLHPYDPASSVSADFEAMVNTFTIIPGWDE